ncbi:DUF2897 family protein [Neptunicella sp. SCSIO 80796]|uniref:DUF2897 family protein n=1 Tax=Neptunicella plasticusilytica TaxID=3117012 RepID=UPI003A4D8F41
MSGWLIGFIVIIVFAVIIGNLLLLKDSAKTKLPSLKDKQSNNAKWDAEDKKDDDW